MGTGAVFVHLVLSFFQDPFSNIKNYPFKSRFNDSTSHQFPMPIIGPIR